MSRGRRARKVVEWDVGLWSEQIAFAQGLLVGALLLLLLVWWFGGSPGP